jgi:hypothetical protein
MLEIEVKGLKELERSLMRLPKKVAAKALRKSVRGFTKHVHTLARRNFRQQTRRNTGETVKQIRIRRVRANDWREVKYRVQGDYRGMFVEFGTEPHKIKTRRKNFGRGEYRKRALADSERNIFFGTKVRHPGTAARPWLQPALTGGTRRGITVMKRILKKEIEGINL